MFQREKRLFLCHLYVTCHFFSVYPFPYTPSEIILASTSYNTLTTFFRPPIHQVELLQPDLRLCHLIINPLQYSTVERVQLQRVLKLHLQCPVLHPGRDCYLYVKQVLVCIKERLRFRDDIPHLYWITTDVVLVRSLLPNERFPLTPVCFACSQPRLTDTTSQSRDGERNTVWIKVQQTK
jgi:hypothetical protein